MRTMIGVLGLVLLIACTGVVPPVPPSPTPTSTSTPSQARSLAILQRFDGPQSEAAAIAALDGTVKARAVFEPRQMPFVGNAAAMVPGEVQVGSAGVYYADGHGVVRLLRPSGEVSVVATFPITPGQNVLSFAVSPDGHRVLAG